MVVGTPISSSSCPWLARKDEACSGDTLFEDSNDRRDESRSKTEEDTLGEELLESIADRDCCAAMRIRLDSTLVSNLGFSTASKALIRRKLSTCLEKSSIPTRFGTDGFPSR